jgi:hypothetical protein
MEGQSAKRSFGFYGLLLSVFGGGLLFAALPWEGWISLPSVPLIQAILRSALPKLGDALMIAPVLVVLIERAAAHELLDAFAENASSHIIGHLLPKELRQHMLKYLNASFVRTRWFIEYKIQELQDAPGFLEVRIMNEYEVENRSYSKRDFKFTYSIEANCHHQDGSSIEHVRAMLVAGDKPIVECDRTKLEELNTAAKEAEKKRKTTGVDPTEKEDGTVRGDGEIVREGGFITYRRDVPVAPNATYQYLTESVERLPKCYSAPFVSKWPVLITTVRILYPKDKLSVDLHLSFADSNVLMPTELVDGVEWIVFEPILPGQCLFAKWQPRPADGEKNDGDKNKDKNNGDAKKSAPSPEATRPAAIPGPPAATAESNAAPGAVKKMG